MLSSQSTKTNKGRSFTEQIVETCSSAPVVLFLKSFARFVESSWRVSLFVLHMKRLMKSIEMCSEFCLKAPIDMNSNTKSIQVFNGPCSSLQGVCYFLLNLRGLKL